MHAPLLSLSEFNWSTFPVSLQVTTDPQLLAKIEPVSAFGIITEGFFLY